MNIKILSRNASLYSTNALVQAAIKRKHNVDVIDPLYCDISIEKENPEIYYKGKKLDHTDAIIPRIGTSTSFYGTAVVRQFEMMRVFTTVTSQAIIESRDKLRSLQRLSTAGLGIPKTIFTNYSRNVAEVIEHVGGTPLIIKLLEGTQGIGVVLAETHNAAESILEAFNGVQARVLVQEYIKETRGVDIRAFVVEGKVVGAIKRQGKEGEFRSNLHRGGTAKTITLSTAEEYTAIKAAKAMNLGVAGVDMLQSHRGPLVLEVNSSPGLEGIETVTQKDIAKSIIKYIERSL